MSSRIDHLDTSRSEIKEGFKDLRDRVDREIKDGGNTTNKRYDTLEKRYDNMDKKCSEIGTRVDRLFYYIIVGLTGVIIRSMAGFPWNWGAGGSPDAAKTE